MVAQHRTRAEIAARYSVTVRTVGNWVAEARKRRLGTFHRASADEMLADTEHLHATLKAKLLRKMDAAEARGDDRLWLECQKQLRALERDRYAIRERVGYFDAYRLAPPGGGAGTGEETPEQVQRSLRGIVEYLMTGKGDPSVEEQANADQARTDADAAPLF